MEPHKPLLAAACMMAAFLPLSSHAQNAEFGIEERVRNENQNNLLDYNGATNDEKEQLRYRTRVWARLPVQSWLDVNVGLNAEMYQRFGQVNRPDEVIFESANVHIKKLFLKGLSLKVGRQDLMRGEGFILMDGTPGDGSRTLYFNAANLAYSFGKSTVEAIGILNPSSDRFLPRIHDQRKALQTWDDQALGLYVTNRDMPNGSVEAYYFHKKEVHDRTSPASRLFQPDRRVETAGGRVTRALGPWSVTVEAARQWGVQNPTTPISAWGAYGYVKHTFQRAWKPYVTAGYWALSGDDPARPDRAAGWDPLFSRWPKWSELEIYSQAPERAVGYASNQKRVQVETGFAPSKRLNWRFTYYHLTAFHPNAKNPAIFGVGLDRGDNLQTRLDFTLNKTFRGHATFETHLPGDFYAHNGRGYFLRFELIAQATRVVKGLFGD